MGSDKKKIVFVVIAVVIAIIVITVLLMARGGTGTPAPQGSAAQTNPANDFPGTPSQTRATVSGAVTIPDANSTSVPSNVAKPTTVVAAGINQPDASARTFEVSVNANKFSPDTIIVKVGDRVRINFTAVDKDYGFTQPDYGFSVPLPKGQKKFVEFGATAEGKFTFYCKSCGGPSRGPVGYIIVAAK